MSAAAQTLGQVCSFGKIFRCYSERFGTHDLLCVKSPGVGREERVRFMEVNPSGEIRELLHFSSAENDRVEKQWDSLLSYYMDLVGSSAPAAVPGPCPDCIHAAKIYDRREAFMAARGNFGIVPLPRKCDKHRTARPGQ